MISVKNNKLETFTLGSGNSNLYINIIRVGNHIHDVIKSNSICFSKIETTIMTLCRKT